MAILRKDKKDHYTVIDNSVFMNYELSYKAKGLLCQMLSLPDGWSFSIEGLARLASDGRDSVATTLKELENAGYFYRTQCRNSGKYQGIEYIIAETPFTENPNTEKPITENPTQLNTKESNTNKSNTNLHTHKEQRPTLEDIEAYISDRNLNVDAKKFYDYFDAGDWLDSKGKPVRSWKQKLITWSNNNGNDFGAGGGVRNGIRNGNGRSKGDDEQVQTGFIPSA